jgi:pantoate--beta-alanine ligase
VGAPLIIAGVAALRSTVAGWRAAGERIALVPTMGALHAGHLSLVDRARREASRSIVSIFVNPTQFAPSEDFGKYPRSFEADVAALAAIGADAVYAPQLAEMYPAGFATAIVPAGPAKAGLEDAFRPTHFEGVATVVAKLLLQALPDSAIFGEKDFQQLAVVRHVARDLDLRTAIIGAATVREADGLAMSSRNVFLTPDERRVAPIVHEVLQQAAAALRAGSLEKEALGAGEARLAASGLALDYLALRDAETLGPAAAGRAARLLVAARLGSVRLIDNIAV